MPIYCLCTVKRKLGIGERFCEDVGGLVSRGDVLEVDNSSFDLLLNKVMTNINMLGLVLMRGVLGKMDGRLIINIDCGRSSDRKTKIGEELL